MKPETRDPKPPIMTVGRYAGMAIDKLPNSYLRWMCGQNFPKHFLDAARAKLEQSDYNDIYLSISRHAIDMFSKRFNHLWLKHIRALGEDGDGIATFMTKLANEAWEHGADVSKRRHSEDGVTKELHGIKWVFKVSPHFPDYKDVITVMDSTG